MEQKAFVFGEILFIIGLLVGICEMVTGEKFVGGKVIFGNYVGLAGMVIMIMAIGARFFYIADKKEE